MNLVFATLLLITAALCAPGVFAGTAAAAHAIAMHGRPKYGPDFQHFDYVNFQAPWLGITAFMVPAVMLSLLIFIGEAVRDAFDPRKTE